MTYIKVFITKKNKIRVRITKIFESKKNIVEEVTIGGEKWKSGKFEKYRMEIDKRVDILINYITKQQEEFLTE